MSKQQIPTVCVQCNKHFMSKKRGTKFCSDICKAQEKRDRDKKLHQSQAKIIKVQAKVIDAILPKPEVNTTIVSTLKSKKSLDLELDPILHEINKMTREAEETAVRAGTIKERWSGYVKDSKRYRELLRMVHEVLDKY